MRCGYIPFHISLLSMHERNMWLDNIYSSFISLQSKSETLKFMSFLTVATSLSEINLSHHWRVWFRLQRHSVLLSYKNDSQISSLEFRITSVFILSWFQHIFLFHSFRINTISIPGDSAKRELSFHYIK